MTQAERERLFVELYEQNRSRLLRLCGGLVGAANADDLFQDVMINVWNGLPRFRGEASPGTWIYRIAVNTALMFRRAAARRGPMVTDGASLSEIPAPPVRVADPRLAHLRAAIASLPPQDRICIVLMLEEFSYKEMAEVTGMTVNHVGVRISRARRALELRMKELDG